MAPAEQMLSDRIQAFFVSQGIEGYSPVFTLDGKPLGATPGLTPEPRPTGLVATNAVASLAATDAKARAAFCGRLVEGADSGRPKPLLRRDALPDEPASRERAVPHLGPAVNPQLRS
jgi:hypothetical protein